MLTKRFLETVLKVKYCMINVVKGLNDSLSRWCWFTFYQQCGIKNRQQKLLISQFYETELQTNLKKRNPQSKAYWSKGTGAALLPWSPKSSSPRENRTSVTLSCVTCRQPSGNRRSHGKNVSGRLPRWPFAWETSTCLDRQTFKLPAKRFFQSKSCIIWNGKWAFPTWALKAPKCFLSIREQLRGQYLLYTLAYRREQPGIKPPTVPLVDHLSHSHPCWLRCRGTSLKVNTLCFRLMPHFWVSVQLWVFLSKSASSVDDTGDQSNQKEFLVQYPLWNLFPHPTTTHQPVGESTLFPHRPVGLCDRGLRWAAADTISKH